MKRLSLLVRSLLFLGLVGGAGLRASSLESKQWTIGGVTRDALLAVPDGTARGAALPLVFAFHGHGGSMRQAAKSFRLHEAWPQALIIYPQGLPTAGALVDPEGRLPGWQSAPAAEGDRDLKFFDAMLADLRAKYQVDPRRIYATGFSNGGTFAYLLWAERGDVLAAVAPGGAVLTHGLAQLRPKPVFHFGSPEDPLVKFEWQARMLDYVLRLNGCGPRQSDVTGYKVYPSTKAAEVGIYLYPGGHRFPEDGGVRIVRFFQAHPAP